ncbi:hypothetical protein [Streptomyces sp. NPDC048106]
MGTGGTEDGDGNSSDLWPRLAKRIRTAANRVDLVLLQEVKG